MVGRTNANIVRPSNDLTTDGRVEQGVGQKGGQATIGRCAAA